MEKKQCNFKSVYRFRWIGGEEFFICEKCATMGVIIAKKLGEPLGVERVDTNRQCEQLVSDYIYLKIT